ncbi:MAG: NAAT family transporter [Candidatus Micrarchaeota archaeon]|nr:NAAT family transporter [Candidatus Micrarchaeota archaeon]
MLDYAFFVTAFIAVLVIINPLSTVGLLLSLTRNAHPKERNTIVFRSSLVAFCVLVIFALSGFLIFQLYSITIEAFRIAGGVVLLVIGMQMLFPKHESAHGTTDYAGKQIYLVPLAIPMTSGPGAISTVVVLASQATGLVQEFSLWIAIFAACAVNYIVLRFSSAINRTIGHEGVAALVKIMGLLVCAVGVQFMINGLLVAFPILAGKPVV